MKTYYSVEYAVQGIGTSIAWFDSKEDAVKFQSAGDYRDTPEAHRFGRQELIDEHDLLVAQTAEWLREREEEGEFLLELSGWGGAREGAGRPEVEDKKIARSIKFSDAEWDEVKERAKESGTTISDYVRRCALGE